MWFRWQCRRYDSTLCGYRSEQGLSRLQAAGRTPQDHAVGEGGDGWVIDLVHPIIVNQTVPTDLETVDGQDVTAQIGNPNGKGDLFNAATTKWGMIGETASWETGPLDISGVTD